MYPSSHHPCLFSPRRQTRRRTIRPSSPPPPPPPLYYSFFSVAGFGKKGKKPVFLLLPPPLRPPPARERDSRSWREEAGRGREAPVRGGEETSRYTWPPGERSRAAADRALRPSLRPCSPVALPILPACLLGLPVGGLAQRPHLSRRRQGGPNPTGCRSPSPASFPPSFHLWPIM